MNPIRRHAYVCAKCHEGANVSFVTFKVHEPKASDPATRKTFASLYYTNWFMYLLIVGTLGFFGLHTLIWMGKESYHAIKEKMAPEPEAKKETAAEPIEAQEPQPETGPDQKEEPERGQKDE
jgi:flagellar biosynthesis/type III secretory pathway M-ring protein FliF/YscJ